MENGYAYFVARPRRIEDLIKPHDIKHERLYRVCKTVVLSKIEYENFITDMLADRQFIENNYSLCSTGEIWNCLLVREHSRTDGVLIIPEDKSYVRYAAYISSGLAD